MTSEEGEGVKGPTDPLLTLASKAFLASPSESPYGGGGTYGHLKYFFLYKLPFLKCIIHYTSIKIKMYNSIVFSTFRVVCP